MIRKVYLPLLVSCMVMIHGWLLGVPSFPMYAFNQGSFEFLRIDDTDGSVLQSIPLDISGDTIDAHYGLTADPATGTLWALQALSSDGDNTAHVVTINPFTGNVVDFGDTGVDNWRGIAIDGFGQMFGLTDTGAIFPIDKQTGVVGLIQHVTSFGSGAFAIDTDNDKYVILTGGEVDDKSLYTINKSPGAPTETEVTYLATGSGINDQLNQNPPGSMTYDHTGTVTNKLFVFMSLSDNDAQFLAADLAAAEPIPMPAIDPSINTDFSGGMAIVPEPSVYGIFMSLGVIGFIRYQRRRR